MSLNDLHMTGVLLAGGKSRRFGENKAWAHFDGLPMIERVLRIMAPIFSKLLLITNTPQQYQSLKLEVLNDLVPDQGPLMGILTALSHTSDPYIFVVACDMPFLDTKLIQQMIQQSDGFNALIPVTQEKKHYLMAIYAKSLLPKMQESFNKGNRSLKDFCQTLTNVHYLPVEEKHVTNINTTHELKKLEQTYAQ